MNLEKLREYCLSKKGAIVDFPFDDITMVIKVGEKMFALMPVNGERVSINLKSDPLVAQGLREKYEAVIPGYHMNKTHWNTVIIDNTIPENIINTMIDDSYDLVYSSLSKNLKNLILQSRS